MNLFRRPVILIIAFSIALFSCYSSRPPQAFPKMEEIEPKLLIGKSTYAEMLKTFGKPSTTSKNFLGYSVAAASNGRPLYLSLLFKDAVLAGYKIIQPGKNIIEKGLDVVNVD